MVGKLSNHRLVIGGCILALVAVVATATARDSSEEAPFGPGGAAYRIPDPTPLFLLQAPIKTDLIKENLLNGIPARTELLLYCGNMTLMHANYEKTALGRLSTDQEFTRYLGLIAKAFEEDFARGDGSYSEAQVEERRLEWEMLRAFYGSADHEFAAFVYWTRGSDDPSFVMIAAAENGNELNRSAAVVREYFNLRREKNSHLSVVDRTHKTTKSSIAIKQINSDQAMTSRESFCVRNNLVIYAKGPTGVDEILDHLDNPDQSLGGKGGAQFNRMADKVGSFGGDAPSDLLLTLRMDADMVTHLPETLQANLLGLVAKAQNQEINVAAGIRFDPKSGKVQEKVYVADSADAPVDDDFKPKSNQFLTARLLDPTKTVVYASTAGNLAAWSDLFIREKLFDSGVPAWLNKSVVKGALGGEMAIVYYARESSQASGDYMRKVVIFEEQDPKDHTAFDTWLLQVKSSCGPGFAGDGIRIPVGDTSIITQQILGNAKENEDLDRAGFEALVERAAENRSLPPDLARAPLNFFPAYAQVNLTDELGVPHSYLLCAYSVTTLRQILANMKQASNLRANIDFRERVNQTNPSIGGVTVFFNTPVALQLMNNDIFHNLTDADARALALGNPSVQKLFQGFSQVYDVLLRGAEPCAFKGSRVRPGFIIEGNSVFGNLAPLALVQAYGQLNLREKEFNKHAALVRGKFQAIKLALDLYQVDMGRFPMRESLPELRKYLKSDAFTPEDDGKKYDDIQTNEFLRVFSLLPNGALLADVEQAKQPQQSNLVYVDTADDRSLGDAVVLYEAKPSGKQGTFFCLHQDGRIDMLSATELAAALPPNNKLKNPYTPALVQALELAASQK